MIYRRFPHAKAATVFSWITGILSALAFLAAIVIGILLLFAKFIQDKMELELFSFRYKINTDWIKLEIILVIAGIVLMFASKFIGRKIAELTIRRKIKKRCKFSKRNH